jgi:hypothetical protein
MCLSCTRPDISIHPSGNDLAIHVLTAPQKLLTCLTLEQVHRVKLGYNGKRKKFHVPSISTSGQASVDKQQIAPIKARDNSLHKLRLNLENLFDSQ